MKLERLYATRMLYKAEEDVPFPINNEDLVQSSSAASPVIIAGYEAINDTRAMSLLNEMNDAMFRQLSPVVAILALLMLIGTVGNLAICYIFGFRLGASTQNLLLLSIGAFDLMSCLVGIPAEIIDMRNYFYFESEHFCKAMRFFTHFPTLASIQVLLIIAADRYRKVCRPLYGQIELVHAKLALVGIVALAFVFSVPALYIYGHRTFPTEIPGLMGRDCSVADRYAGEMYPIVYQSTLGVAFFVSSTALIVIYFRVWMETRRHKRYMKAHTMPAAGPLNTSKEEEGGTPSDHEDTLTNGDGYGGRRSHRGEDRSSTLYRHESGEGLSGEERQRLMLNVEEGPPERRSLPLFSESELLGEGQRQARDRPQSESLAGRDCSPEVLLQDSHIRTEDQSSSLRHIDNRESREVVGLYSAAENGFASDIPFRLVSASDLEGGKVPITESENKETGVSIRKTFDPERRRSLPDMNSHNTGSERRQLPDIRRNSADSSDNMTSRFQKKSSQALIAMKNTGNVSFPLPCTTVKDGCTTTVSGTKDSSFSTESNVYFKKAIASEIKAETTNYGNTDPLASFEIESDAESSQTEVKSVNDDSFDNLNRSQSSGNISNDDSTSIASQSATPILRRKPRKNQLPKSFSKNGLGHALLSKRRLRTYSNPLFLQASANNLHKSKSSQSITSEPPQERKRSKSYSSGLNLVAIHKFKISQSRSSSALQSFGSSQSQLLSQSTRMRTKSCESLAMRRVKQVFRARPKPTRMTVLACAITSAFVLSYLPHLSLALLRSVWDGCEYEMEGASLVLYNLFLRSYFANLAINIFVYGTMSREFRDEVNKIWRRMKQLCFR